MTFNIETAFLDDEDADRVYERFPELKTGKCPTCGGAGSYRWHGLDHECVCSLQLQLAKHYCLAGIGLTYQRLGWDDYEGQQGRIGEVVNVYLSRPEFIDRGIGLLFYGELGTGKTLVANLILKDLVKQGYECYATTFANTVEAFTATWGSQQEKRWFARKFMHSKVLLLDDLGREFRTKNALPQTTFDNILRTRVSTGRPTILTTNLAPDELGHGYGAGVLSLLREQSMACEMNGEDFRPRAAQRTIDELMLGEVRPIT